MAFSVPLRDLNSDERSIIRRDFTVKKNKSQFNQDPQLRRCFSSDKKEVYLPLGKWNMLYHDFPHFLEDYPQISIQFKMKLYTCSTDPRGIRDQTTLAKQAISRLKSHHSCLIACHTGYGKTLLSIYLVTWAKLKTVVLVFSEVLQRQWKREIEKSTTAKVQLIKNSKDRLDPRADIYIIGVKRASAMPRRTFSKIGMVVLDEAHIATEASFCKTLLKFKPYYLIGATATPRRPDGLHRIFYLYFGPPKSFLIREERNKSFRVIKYKTYYKPEIEYRTVFGKLTLQWSKVQTSIASNISRQKEIVKIVLDNPCEKVLILSARKDQSNGIYKMLLEEGEDAELLIGNKKVWDKDKRVLVAGMKKAGVGFDDPKLTMLILASDVKNVRQYEGRLRTDNCLIYDIVDDFSTFERHWEIRAKWYLRKGANIEFEGSQPQKVISSKPPRFLSPNRE